MHKSLPRQASNRSNNRKMQGLNEAVSPPNVSAFRDLATSSAEAEAELGFQRLERAHSSYYYGTNLGSCLILAGDLTIGNGSVRFERVQRTSLKPNRLKFLKPEQNRTPKPLKPQYRGSVI